MTKKLFYNGDILTLEDELYAEAVLVEDGKIKAVGKKDELMIQNSDAEMIDLQGKTLMPSFIDAHSHFFGYANSKLQVSLEDAVDFDDIANRIKTFIEKNNVPEGVWINANNFDYNTLAEKTYPRIDFLDEVVPNNPIIIANKSGHNGLVNSLGMKELGITIQNHKKRIILKIENTSQPVDVKNINTSKKDKKNHGYGISNIRRVVDKYNGTMQIKYVDGRFLLEMLI